MSMPSMRSTKRSLECRSTCSNGWRGLNARMRLITHVRRKLTDVARQTIPAMASRPVIDSPQKAVRAAIVAEHRARESK